MDGILCGGIALSTKGVSNRPSNSKTKEEMSSKLLEMAEKAFSNFSLSLL
jgi:hypothetical protein